MITTRHFGFDYPPVGLINALEQLEFRRDPLIYIIDPLNRPDIPYQDIQASDKTNLFVIIYTHEGASHQWFDILIPRLHQQCGVPMDQIILHSSCLYDPHSPILHVGSIVDYASDIRSKYQEWTSPKLSPSQYHFVCMNRMHRWQRLALVLELIDNQSCEHGAVSYLDSRCVPAAHGHRFPMVLDDQQVSWAQGHELIHHLTVSAVNVITESCYEPEPGTTVLDTHHRPGLTEKTFKAIHLAQFPIFLAPWTTVNCYRHLGFDAFDDVIDHSYDTESDPVLRIQKVAAEIHRITQIPLDTLDQMRHDRWDRFQANFDLLDHYAFNHLCELPIWRNRLSKWLVDR